MELLKQHHGGNLTMSFGISWGEWEDIYTTADEIKNEISKQELLTEYEFGYNDFFIKIEELEVEIKFCHETDLHFSFSHENKLVIDVLTLWKNQELIYFVRKNGKEFPIDDFYGLLNFA